MLPSVQQRRSTALRLNEMSELSNSESRRFFGFLERKQRWELSWRGWLVLGLLTLLVGYEVFLNVHSFLAVTHRVNTKVLVVEGWIQRYGFLAAEKEFKTAGYERIFTTGGPENGSGGYVNDYQTLASAAAEELKKIGVPERVIQVVPSHEIGRERTFSSAIALREWLLEHGTILDSLNIITNDCHARRTQLLFQQALGKNVKVGIIAVPNPDYDPRYWWRYSDGVREVISEGAAYIYARVFFHPRDSKTGTVNR